jgi:hypothetical protein
MADEKTLIDTKVDVGVLKTQVAMLTQLCNKMDAVIDKLVDQQDRIVNQIYTDMEKRKTDTNTDIKELHSRITTVDRSLSDKLELTERRIMDKIEALQAQIAEHNRKEDSDLKKLLEWKWMAAGGIIVLTWAVSNANLSFLSKLFA